MAPGAILATNAITAETGAMIALAIALAAAVVRARGRAETRTAAVAAENEALRDEVWRLREAVAGQARTEEARRRAILGEEARGGYAAVRTEAPRGATRLLVVGGSPDEAPPIVARLEASGAEVARADGLLAGLAALRRGPQPDLVIVDSALGAVAADALSSALDVSGARRSLLLSASFEPRALGSNISEERSPFERLAGAFLGEIEPEVRLPRVVERPDEAFDRNGGLPRAS